MNNLTDIQRRHFFAALHKTAAELSVDSEAYRKMILKEELGVDHLSEVNRTTGYEKLMARIAKDSGDYESAVNFAIGDLNRIRHLIREAAKKIAGERYHEYIAGTLIKMNISHENIKTLAMRLERDQGWEDFLVRELRKVLAAFSSHLKRHHCP